MGQHQYGQVEVGFEGFEVLHEAERHGSVFGTAAQAGDVIDLETNQVVKSDGKRKMSKRDKDELLKKSREQMR